MTTHMDALVMNDFLLLKEDQKKVDEEKLKFKRIENKGNVSKNSLKARKDAERIYQKYFPELKKFQEKITTLQSIKESTWTPSPNDLYFDEIDPQRKITPDTITGNWIGIPEKDREKFTHFLKDVIKLSYKHKLEISEIENTVSESIYVMF